MNAASYLACLNQQRVALAFAALALPQLLVERRHA